MAETPLSPAVTISPRKVLSIDLSTLPPLITPAPPSNTLLITNLNDPSIFHPASLTTVRDLINRSATLHSFSPLKSFRRIICSFYNEDDAIRIRQLLDGESIAASRVRIYFGEPTPINPADQHLAAPESNRLFFISPPPSPPHGWEMRNEEPPNKAVHADDLASALAKLHTRPGPNCDVALSPVTPVDKEDGEGVVKRVRSRSTTLVYNPEEHGGSPLLPAVMVEDTTGEEEKEEREETIMAHTARPPVELMHDA